jgi:hypothetical protein
MPTVSSKPGVEYAIPACSAPFLESEIVTHHWLCEEPNHSFRFDVVLRRGWPGLADIHETGSLELSDPDPRFP